MCIYLYLCYISWTNTMVAWLGSFPDSRYWPLLYLFPDTSPFSQRNSGRLGLWDVSVCSRLRSVTYGSLGWKVKRVDWLDWSNTYMPATTEGGNVLLGKQSEWLKEWYSFFSKKQLKTFISSRSFRLQSIKVWKNTKFEKYVLVSFVVSKSVDSTIASVLYLLPGSCREVISSQILDFFYFHHLKVGDTYLFPLKWHPPETKNSDGFYPRSWSQLLLSLLLMFCFGV